MKSLPVTLLALAALAGCQANLTALVKPAAKPPASTKPGPAATRAPAAPTKLVRPAAGATVLSGHVSLDPSYVVGLAAGQLIAEAGGSVLAAGKVVSNDGASIVSNDGASVVSNDGASAIAPNGASIISNDGASIISNDGASVLARGAGNVIAPAEVIAKDAGGIISNDGASVVSNDGASVVSNDGASVVSNDGASAIAPNGASFGLLAAKAPTHELTPAAGMAVYVRDLTTHAKIPLGQGPDGKPAFAVYTDLKGGYELYLPPGLTGNVEVVAFLPDKRDQRLHLQQVAPAAVTGNPVDEDTSAVVNYIRFGFRQFTSILITGDDQKVRAASHLDELALPPAYGDALKDITGRIRAAGIPQIADQAGRDRVADRITDIVLAHARLDLAAPSVTVHGTKHPFPPEIEAHSLAVLAENFRRRRQDMASHIDDPAERARIEQLPVVQEANRRDGVTYTFRRPSDYGDFVAKAIVGVPGTDPTAVTAAIDRLDNAIGLPNRDGTSDWVQAAFGGVVGKLSLALFLDGDVQEGLDKLFAEGRKP